MRRVGNLAERLLSFWSLCEAFRRAKRGTKTAEMCAFALRHEDAVWDLQEQLLLETYVPDPYRYFKIYEPKPRIISVASFRDRVVHHALVGVLEPIWERRFIADSYATRVGRGVHKAILRAQQGVRAHRWFLKMDIRSYFPSMDHAVLERLLSRVIKDSFVLRLCNRIISCGGDGRVGLPIGNLTSQFFANVYLDPFDHWIKERCRIRHYIRYMDDFVVFGDDAYTLRDMRDRITDFLARELSLQVKEEVTQINTRLHGLPFLGMRIFPSLLRHRRESFQRSYRKLCKAIAEHEKTGDSLSLQRINSLCAVLRVWGGHMLQARLRRDM